MLNLKKKTMSKPIDYLMDPQPWNPVCNRYLVRLNEAAKSLNKQPEVSDAYNDCNVEIDKQKERLIKRLKSILGPKWDEVIAEP